MEKSVLIIGDWRVSPEEGTLRRDNETVHLEPRVMDVLVYLAKRQGEVISRDELEREVWRGALVGYDAVTSTIIKLRKALGDNARQARMIITVPKKGYQLVAAVNDAEMVVTPDSTPADVGIAPVKPPAKERRIFVLTVVSIIAISLVVILYSVHSMRGARRVVLPTVMVLPFENMDAGGRIRSLC